MSPVSILLSVLLVVALGLGALMVWRFSDRVTMRQTWAALAATAPSDADLPRFDPAMVADLPEAAQRYLTYTISPGTPLYPAARIDMTGTFGTGTQAAPGYRPMTAAQLLAPPHGFVWAMRSGAIGGSDGIGPALSWTRFWLFGLVPVARAGGTPDHHRSAFGRLAADAAIWVPGSLLLTDEVTWEDAGPDIARYTMRHGDLGQTVDIMIAPNGMPRSVVFQRWSNENPDRVFREQPFGGTLAAFQDVNGYRLPMQVEAGNHFGTDAYFAFFRAEVQGVRFTDLAAP